MNNVELLLKKFNQMESYAEVASKSKRDFENILERKVLHLHYVGNSVLRKQLGSERYNKLNTRHVFSELSASSEWLLVFNPKITFDPWKTDLKKANFTITGTSRDGSYLSYSVPASILTQSDRDFAKEVRKNQRTAIIKQRDCEIDWAKTILKNAEARERKIQKVSKQSKIKGEI